MEPLKIYDYLTLARGQIFERVRPLSAEQYAREFPIGHETLGRTLTHIMISEWYYVQRIGERDVPPDGQWPIQQENPPPFAALEAAWIEQADHTRAALSAVRDWSADLEYRVTPDDGRPQIVTTSAGDIFTQLILHEVHSSRPGDEHAPPPRRRRRGSRLQHILQAPQGVAMRRSGVR